MSIASTRPSLNQRYHVTVDYLLNEGNIYSVEFDTFLSHICRAVPGTRAFTSTAAPGASPASLALLSLPFSLSQTYRMLPRFTAKLADTDLRVGTVTRTKASVVEWHAEKDLDKVSEALHPLFTELVLARWRKARWPASRGFIPDCPHGQR